ncbi:MAG: 50S ribosomal protein L32 [Verrucomicrobiales bacterium]|nr:50S ribosomal protein L32 [Verrucomicrobiales bacterium]
MPVPKRKISRTRRRKRQGSNSRMSLPQVNACPQCAEPYIPHRACPACGFYKERKVLATKAAA